jgi:hypothetical protein
MYISPHYCTVMKYLSINLVIIIKVEITCFVWIAKIATQIFYNPLRHITLGVQTKQTGTLMVANTVKIITPWSFFLQEPFVSPLWLITMATVQLCEICFHEKDVYEENDHQSVLLVSIQCLLMYKIVCSKNVIVSELLCFLIFFHSGCSSSIQVLFVQIHTGALWSIWSQVVDDMWVQGGLCGVVESIQWENVYNNEDLTLVPKL